MGIMFPTYLTAQSLYDRRFLNRLVRLIQIFTRVIGLMKVLQTGQKYLDITNEKLNPR